MTCFRSLLLLLLFVYSICASAQTIKYLGTDQHHILENVEGYLKVEIKSIEHEEFDIVVFRDERRELSFYFSFYRGAKICSYIKNTGPIHRLEQEIQYIKTNFQSIRENVWENTSKTVQAEIHQKEDIGVITIKLKN